jgi:exopolyphosphatase/guanosine-5'-triphosphate,3'-diphosphate pyrophosphatase
MAAPHYAALDLGTNTFRLLIAHSDPSIATGYRPLHVERVITRAGGGFTPERGIAPDAAARIVACLQKFSAELRRHDVAAYRAAATSVFRRSPNGAAVLALVRETTGVEAEVIDGAREADLSAQGAAAQVALDGPAVIFDIGGGSTEYIVWKDGAVLGRRSFEFGVVRLAEDVLKTDPPAADELERLAALVRPLVRQAAGEAKALLGGAPFTLVGTAGTVSTLGAIDLGLTVYDRDRINGHWLERAFVEGNYARFCAMRRGERVAVPGMEEGREDLIVPGCFIAAETMAALGAGRLLVSEGGLLEGLLFEVMRRNGVTTIA